MFDLLDWANARERLLQNGYQYYRTNYVLYKILYKIIDILYLCALIS
jgi:hypothetical protein